MIGHMIMKNWWLPALLLFFVCSRDDGRITGTGGSKSPNAFVQGTVTCDGCGDASGASLVLFSINPEEDGYSWYPIDSTVTDSAGMFSFDSLEGGEYSITCEKSGYEGFSGYFDVMDNDTVTVDSLVLKPSISIIGMFQFFNRDHYLVSIIGTEYSYSTAPDSSADSGSTVSEPHRYFAFDGIAPGKYHMKVAIDYLLPTEMVFTVPLNVSPDAQIDTAYADTLNGVVSTVEISGTMITIYVEDIFKLICIYAENPVAGKAAVMDMNAILIERLDAEVKQ